MRNHFTSHSLSAQNTPGGKLPTLGQPEITSLPFDAFCFSTWTTWTHSSSFKHPDFDGYIYVSVDERPMQDGTSSFEPEISGQRKGKRCKRRTFECDYTFETLDAALLWAYRRIGVVPKDLTEAQLRGQREKINPQRPALPVEPWPDPNKLRTWVAESGKPAGFYKAKLMDGFKTDSFEARPGDRLHMHCTETVPLNVPCIVKTFNRPDYYAALIRKVQCGKITIQDLEGGEPKYFSVDDVLIFGQPEKLSRNGEIIWMAETVDGRICAKGGSQQ